MTHELKRLDSNGFEIILTLPWNEVNKTYEQVFNDVVKTAEVDGFRKGKAPKEIVEKKIDKNKIYEEVIKILLPKAYSDAVAANNLKPIINPEIETLEIAENKDWKFKAKACEMPIVDLKDYKKVISDANAKDKIWVPGKEEKKTEEEDKNKKFAKNMDKLLETAGVGLSDMLIDSEINHQLAQLLDEIKRLGLTLDQYLSTSQKTLDQLKAEYREKAVNTLKMEFLLEKISDEEKITVTDEEINKAIEETKDEKTKNALNQNKYQLASLLKRQKTLDFISGL
ncbi:MAG: hypothetical protein M1120_03785 [Patescibacteria group bacterium]|nr:hypothetical protein [Patescibacteria group bacterium]